MQNPKKELLVIAIIVGDLKTKIIGYYHYDLMIDTHYVCDYKDLKRYEVYEYSITLNNKIK